MQKIFSTEHSTKTQYLIFKLKNLFGTRTAFKYFHTVMLAMRNYVSGRYRASCSVSCRLHAPPVCSQSLVNIDFCWFLPEPPVLLVKPVSCPSVSEQTGDVPKQSVGSGSGPAHFSFFNGSVSGGSISDPFVYCTLIHCDCTGWRNVLLRF